MSLQLAVILLLSITACQAPLTGGRDIRVRHGVVVSVDRYASEIGARVLRDGGNAVDAAVAVALAMAVTWPQAGNLGGGGFMLVAMADGRTAAIDYRETAPAAARADLFLNERGEVDEERANLGYWPAGVPGTVRGLEAALDLFGTKSFAELVQPALQLARHGFLVDDDLARALQEHAEDLKRFPETARVFFNRDGEPLRSGDILVQEELAISLETLAREGPAAFYEGRIAQLIAADMARSGALMTLEDLRSYRARVREPLRLVHEGYEILTMPPPSSGGVALAQALLMLGPAGIAEVRTDSAEFYHLVAESLRRVFADRAAYLGDPDFVDLPVDWLLSEAHVTELRGSIERGRASSSEQFGPPVSPPPEGEQTTHFSVVDAAGNAVANTTTLEEIFGAKVMVSGTGVLLNNELHDFNVKPGETTTKGRIGTRPNLVAPGKRPLSSMSPTIVRRDGETVFVTGSPGGRTIISTVVLTVLRVIVCGLDPAVATAAPRIHHQWQPDILRVEERLGPALREALQRLGHRLEVGTRQGDTQSIFVDRERGWRRGIADDRIDGWAAGY
ncbi:MAG: gamma-glutamyltransferase [Planctomycetota bacterium]